MRSPRCLPTHCSLCSPLCPVGAPSVQRLCTADAGASAGRRAAAGRHALSYPGRSARWRCGGGVPPEQLDVRSRLGHLRGRRRARHHRGLRLPGCRTWQCGCAELRLGSTWSEKRTSLWTVSARPHHINVDVSPHLSQGQVKIATQCMPRNTAVAHQCRECDEACFRAAEICRTDSRRRYRGAERAMVALTH